MNKYFLPVWFLFCIKATLEISSGEKQCVQNADSWTIPARQNHCYCVRKEGGKRSCEKGPFHPLLQHDHRTCWLFTFLLLPLPNSLFSSTTKRVRQKSQGLDWEACYDFFLLDYFQRKLLAGAFREIEMCKKSKSTTVHN